MKLGKFKNFIIFFLCLTSVNLKSEDKITTIPLINLDKLKPSYEDVNNENIFQGNNNFEIKKKNKTQTSNNYIIVNIMGLDKITAKTTKINLKLGETKKFGLLEIKAIQCGKIKSKDEKGEAAYLQIKDMSEKSDEKIFVFNGWTFSSSPSLRPVDHPVYDIWLLSCENV
jgi:hypothetical protein